MFVNSLFDHTNAQASGQRAASGHDDIRAEGIKPMKLHISNVEQDATDTKETEK